MGAQWCESFQVYPSVANMLQGVWAQIDAPWALSTANPASGVQSMHCHGPSAGSTWPAMRRVYDEAVATGGAALRFWVSNLPSSEGDTGALMLLTALDVAANGLVAFVLGTNGAIVAYGGGRYQFGGGNLTSWVLLGRSNPCVVAAAYNHIECRVTPGLTGAFECRVNGVTVLNFSGDTVGRAELGEWAVGGATTVNGVTDMYFGDLHAWDTLATPGPTDFVGNASVRTRLPDSDDGAHQQWSYSTGSTGWPLLIDNNDATYISAASTSLESAFGAGSYEADVQGIVYQQVNFRAIKTDVGDCNVTPGIISAGSTGLSTERILSTGEAWYWGIVALDPATSAPFTVAAANASELLVERTL